MAKWQFLYHFFSNVNPTSALKLMQQSAIYAKLLADLAGPSALPSANAIMLRVVKSAALTEVRRVSQDRFVSKFQFADQS